MPPLELPTPLVIALNSLVWPALQLSIAWAILKCPASWFEAGPPARDRRPAFEHAFYTRVLRVRAWKPFVPDAARWFRGAPKSLPRRDDPAALGRLVTETRRGEVAHWLMILPTPVFFLWNPAWADGVMIAYALSVNLPCIVVQRFVRMRLQAALHRRGETREAAAAGPVFDNSTHPRTKRPDPRGGRIHRVAAAGNVAVLATLVAAASLADVLFDPRPTTPSPLGPGLESGLGPNLESHPPASRAVLVVIDGLRDDTASDPEAMSVLRRLAAAGGRGVARVECLVPSSVAAIETFATGRVPRPASFLADFGAAPAAHGGLFADLSAAGRTGIRSSGG